MLALAEAFLATKWGRYAVAGVVAVLAFLGFRWKFIHEGRMRQREDQFHLDAKEMRDAQKRMGEADTGVGDDPDTRRRKLRDLFGGEG